MEKRRGRCKKVNTRHSRSIVIFIRNEMEIDDVFYYDGVRVRGDTVKKYTQGVHDCGRTGDILRWR